MASDLMDALEQVRESFAPVFQAQRDEWEKKGPSALARADALGIVIESKGGNCPVQAEGHFDDCRFYFRARGEAWSLNVWRGTEAYLSAENPNEWWIERDYGEAFEAGWMPLHEAVGFICDGVETYRADAA